MRPGQEGPGSAAGGNWTASPAGRRASGAAAATLLAAGVLVWAAAPGPASGPARLALDLGIAAALLTPVQLALAAAVLAAGSLDALAERALHGLGRLAQRGPWAEGVVVAAVVLEAGHPARPWHTAVLAVALLAFLLAVHCGETAAAARALAPQLPLLAAGAGLAVLAAAAGELPGLGSGPGALVLRILAAIAAVLAAALSIPF